MKKILITGKNSYVGNSFEKWLENYPKEYVMKKISLRDGSWRDVDFSGYDVVLHVAGIAHIKETKENEQLYYKVNRDLAYEVAKKAKGNGVKHFVFLSSMSVYGMETGMINIDTVPNPKNSYGKSKLEAEELIDRLSDNSFKVATLRPPMIYGKGCKGNYQRLAKLAVKTPIIPDIENQRSMIFTDNLSEFIRKIIEFNRNGLFFPQNKDYVCTTKLVKVIAKVHKKKIIATKLFNPMIKRMKNEMINKVFGDLVYEKSISFVDDNLEYRLVSFEESIKRTEE